MSASLAGTSLDRYQLTALLGEGALGAVYRAYDSKLEREVAVRVLPSRLAERRDLHEQFLQEVRTAVRLRHPGLVRVLDFGQVSPHVYLVSEYLPGAPLGRLLKTVAAGGTWPPLSETLHIARAVCRALGQLHQRGLLHHAVHAGNILLRAEPGEALPYQPVLTDVGLGRLRDSGPVTEATLYLSPEHVQGRPLDARSDLFALGLILYELAAGRPPFALEPGLEAARAHFAGPVTPLRAFRPDLPESVERLIVQALALNPDERFPDAAALGAALDAALPEALSLETQPLGAGSESALLAAHQRRLAEPPLTSATPTSGAAPETMAFTAPPALEPDRIQILDPDHRSRTVPMKPGGLTIGRDPASDIVIDHPKVSRHHARIDYDGVSYRVTDLKSTNGTLLNNMPVLPDVPQPWPPEAPLRIGDSWLRLELAGAAALAATSRAAIVRADGSAVDVAQVQFSPGAGLVGLYVDTPRLSVLPGGSAIATLYLLNQGPAEDRFLITLEGVPPTWLATMPGAIRVPPGGQQEVRLVFQPPRAPSSRAGRHVIRLRVASQSAPDQAAEARLALAVGAFNQFAAELRPERLRPRGQGRVTIENQGNAAETFTLELSDPEGALRFTPHEARVKVDSGEAASLDFHVAPRRTRLIGREEAYPYTAQVSAPDGQKRSLNGQAAVGAALPPWAPVALAGLLLFGLVGAIAAAVWLSQPDPGIEATRLAEAARGTAGAAQTAFFDLTRTAVWLAADDDNDGLSNQRERETGTLLTTFDTDADGWSDGEEVNFRKTDPLNADTDGDGLIDSQDPDPGLAPTATNTPTPTATATATSTPTATLTPLISPTASATPTQTLTPVPGAPNISAMSPTTATVGAGQLTIILTGTNFIAGSQVRWNDENLATTVSGPTQITAQIPADKLTTGGTFQIKVFSPTQGGVTSNAQTFTVNNPLPVVNSLSPTSRSVGSGQFTLVVTGANFVPGAQVQWNGASRPTTFDSSTQLSAVINAGDLSAVASVTVRVVNPAPGGGQSAAVAFTINQATTTTSITGRNPTASVVGQSVTVSFGVTVNAPGSGTPTGSVVVTVSGGSETCNAALSNGAGSCSLTLTSAGNRTLTATYGGDANFSGSAGATAHQVDKANTTTTITADNPEPSVVGQAVTVNVTVGANPPGNGTPTGSVVVTVSGGAETCNVTLSGGAGSCSLTLTAPGNRTVTATYGGDANFNGSSDTESHQVNQASTNTSITADSPDSSVVGQAVTVSFVVAANAPGSGTPTGSVVVTVSGGSETCNAALSNGAGSCSLTLTAPGSRTVTATYGGDANFSGSSDTESHQVDKANTTTTINSDNPDPSVAVTEAVTVDFAVIVNAPGSGTPTGTVTVTVSGGMETCSGALSGGAGSCSLTFAVTGTRTLTATYGGDVNFNGSSDTEPHQVNASSRAKIKRAVEKLPAPAADKVFPDRALIQPPGPGRSRRSPD